MKTPEQYDKSVQSYKYRHQNDVKRHLYTSHHCKIESVQNIYSHVATGLPASFSKKIPGHF